MHGNHNRPKQAYRASGGRGGVHLRLWHERTRGTSLSNPRGIHLNRHALKLLGAPANHLANPRAKWLCCIRHLRYRELDRTLGPTSPVRPITISVTTPKGTALVIAASQRILGFRLQRLLHDQCAAWRTRLLRSAMPSPVISFFNSLCVLSTPVLAPFGMLLCVGSIRTLPHVQTEGFFYSFNAQAEPQAASPASGPSAGAPGWAS